MITELLAILFLFKLKLCTKKPISEYLIQKYNRTTLGSFRKYEEAIKKRKKTELDLEFLQYCKLNNITPNFVKFKLYKKSLYSSEFYKSALDELLNIEIRSKTKSLQLLSDQIPTLLDQLKSKVSTLDFISLKSLAIKNCTASINHTKLVHQRKLRKLGIHQPNFNNPNDVIFNYSNHTLTNKERFLLSLGLNFSIPFFHPNFPKFFLPFERLAHSLKNFSTADKFPAVCNIIRTTAHKHFQQKRKQNSWLPFFNLQDLNILKNLSRMPDLLICRPDKGRGVVLMNRGDYKEKMLNLLSDSTKFCLINSSPNKLINTVEDKINRTLRNLKNNNYINDLTYSSLYSTGSSLSVLYGLPKTHKPNLPLRPILAAYNSASYALAKFLVPLLSHLTTNHYTLNNSYDLIHAIKKLNSSSFMVSLDVQSLFTSLPLQECIDLIMNNLFPNPSHNFKGFNYESFKQLLELSVLENYFTFDNQIYKQTDGISMGSPLGPTFANIFMCNFENNFLNNCPIDFKPTFYKRYIDDTFLLFKNKTHAHSFLTYINSLHPNIKFTIETEQENKLSFLDISISRTGPNFSTSVFRKSTFSGLGLNFYSYSPINFKINSIKTLLSRAFKLCSTWALFHDEVTFLHNFFNNNSYPDHIFNNTIKKFLQSVFEPKPYISLAPKMKLYIPLPYLGTSTSTLEKDLAPLFKLFPFIDFKFIFNNPYKIGNLFKLKDAIPDHMRANIIYQYTCPRCNRGTYIGSTERRLMVRIAGHKGISHRTLTPLNTKELSAPRDHANKCHSPLKDSHFKIISQASDKISLLVLESLYIKELQPTLNSNSSSIPLLIA